jgi:hypothetical protein
MTRTLTILATIVAVAALAAPALAGTSKPPPGAAGYTHTEQIESLKAPQKKGTTNLRAGSLDRPPVGFIFDLSLVR